MARSLIFITHRRQLLFWAAAEPGKATARDLWLKKDLGVFGDGFSAFVPKHGVVLIRNQGGHADTASLAGMLPQRGHLFELAVSTASARKP
ncbi:MAG TPA: hypothetical protein VN622_10170 [Clostridia bacterium]|nr:hypothetical protein [Clostridia bacterium]